MPHSTSRNKDNENPKIGKVSPCVRRTDTIGGMTSVSHLNLRESLAQQAPHHLQLFHFLLQLELSLHVLEVVLNALVQRGETLLREATTTRMAASSTKQHSMVQDDGDNGDDCKRDHRLQRTNQKKERRSGR